MMDLQAYRGRRVVVLGLARSGAAAAKLFAEVGAAVIANDQKPRELCPEASELEALGISVVCGHHPDDLVTKETALLVKNPGIPYSAGPVAAALALGVETVTEVEVAGLISPAPIIGITGSNGKTTTTTLTGILLEAAGLSPLVAGNIGRPLCDAAGDVRPDGWLVAELSSFQLKGTVDFRPRISCLLNVAETHLDYHGTMDDYVASKAQLFANQTEDDIAVYNADDATCVRLAEGFRAAAFPFSLTRRLPEGVYVEPPYAAAKPGPDEEDADAPRRIVARLPASRTGPLVARSPQGKSAADEIFIADVDEIGIPGRHNLANALAAIAIALAAGAAPSTLVEPLRLFRGVEHRLEYVGRFRGADYYNDSKATNPIATTMSVLSLPSPLVLIAGGLDRGSDYMELLPVFRDRLKGLVALGETREKLRKVADVAGLAAVKTVEPDRDAENTLRQAVEEAAKLAGPGDIVLLSPACASWDMFSSYEVRGRMFKQSAHTL